ncbi:calx-beta domain protein [bacterium BMS3Abin07]|nr:calx-beta domain protein [bacterium BMS3Abin07]
MKKGTKLLLTALLFLSFAVVITNCGGGGSGSASIIQLSSSAYSVNEANGSVSITAARTGGNSGAVSVDYATSDGTATAGSDYTAAAGTLNWADGDSSDKTFKINITNDTDPEGNETFSARLTNPTAAILGTPAAAVVTIMDSSGTLDTTFNSAGTTPGIVTTAIGTGVDKAYAVAIQSDGKIVAAGSSYNGAKYNFAVVRYNTDGTLDTTFDSAGTTPGIVTTAIGTGVDEAYAVAIQSDGKIVAAGSSEATLHYDFALVRYNTDGTLDTTTFNSAGTTPGIVTTAIGTGDNEANAVAIQSDGKIVAAGYSNNGTNNDFAIVCYKTDGSLDTSFGSGGIATTAIGTGALASDVAIQSDGKIVATGYSNNGTNNDFATVRYKTDGSLDTSFGSGGIATTAIGTGDSKANAVAIQSDGKIVVAGDSAVSGTTFGFTLVRYKTDGSLDTSFGSGGIATTAIGTGALASDVAIQSDGKIVAAGASALSGTTFGFTLVRYKTDGSLDTTFNSAETTPGIVITPIGLTAFVFNDAIQPDGKIVAAGVSNNGSYGHFTVVRYLP